jgi:hypothetical protein
LALILRVDLRVDSRADSRTMKKSPGSPGLFTWRPALSRAIH